MANTTMLSSSFLRRSLIPRPLLLFHAHRLPQFRCITNQSATPQPQKQSWLTHKVQTSPTSKKLFMAAMKLFGYGSPKQLAGRRAFVLYERVCVVKPDEDRQFWADECSLPPTFQSWFTITNLHIWMLTCRLRALPPEHGRFYIEALVDHFFIDVEDRIRAVLQPPAKPREPYTATSSFYVNPNVPTPAEKSANPKQRVRMPDRLVTQQMKIFREQWMGMGMSLDLGLVRGDMELAGAVWRNMLGARGAQGIAYPGEGGSTRFRRHLNFVGGEVINISKVNLEQEEAKDDGSGVHDFPPEDVDKYLAYPEVMLDIVGYIRRELARLQSVTDAAIMSEDWEQVKFKRVKETKV